MATDHIRYDVLARDALRGVLRRVLADAAEHGLPGDHHFFITFTSTAEGVKITFTYQNVPTEIGRGGQGFVIA